MFDFVTHIIFVASLVVIIYLFARALPRVADDAGSVPSSAFDKLVDRLPLERVDEALISTFEKFLRKVRVLVRKLDNTINRHLEQVRRQSPALKEQEATELKEKFEAMTTDDSLDKK